jgi:hypothetical protein
MDCRQKILLGVLLSTEERLEIPIMGVWGVVGWYVICYYDHDLHDFFLLLCSIILRAFILELNV